MSGKYSKRFKELITNSNQIINLKKLVNKEGRMAPMDCNSSQNFTIALFAITKVLGKGNR